ncbi:MAG: glycosyltransferase [Anaerolineae bacterium]|nr:glycosyltransferase [Anaerolineae bacterium]
MRVVMITTHPPGKGSLNEYAFHFIRCLRQKSEVEAIILLVDELDDGGTYHDVNIPAGDSGYKTAVTVKPCWRFGAWNNPLRILNAVKAARPDVVLFNIQFASFGSGKIPATLGLFAPALVKRAGYPTVVLLHNIMETVDLQNAGFAGNPFIDMVIRFFGNLVTRLILTVDLVALTIPKYVEILTEKYKATNVFLAPHGSFEDATALPDFDLPAGPLKIMAFGKFGTYKRIETLIEAFERLQNSSRPPLELVIAGADSPNTPDYLAGVRQQYAHVPNITFTGYVAEEEVPRIFGESAVVVFPYTSTTGSSGVLHQAGSYGKAAVLPQIGDFAELIAEEGYTGEFFEPASADSLANAIARIIDHPARRIEIGRQNFAASQGVPINEVVDWYLLHFETLLDKPASATPGRTAPEMQRGRGAGAPA